MKWWYQPGASGGGGEEHQIVEGVQVGCNVTVRRNLAKCGGKVAFQVQLIGDGDGAVLPYFNGCYNAMNARGAGR